MYHIRRIQYNIQIYFINIRRIVNCNLLICIDCYGLNVFCINWYTKIVFVAIIKAIELETKL